MPILEYPSEVAVESKGAAAKALDGPKGQLR
jgi:hypothetical protein